MGAAGHAHRTASGLAGPGAHAASLSLPRDTGRRVLLRVLHRQERRSGLREAAQVWRPLDQGGGTESRGGSSSGLPRRERLPAPLFKRKDLEWTSSGTGVLSGQRWGSATREASVTGPSRGELARTGSVGSQPAGRQRSVHPPTQARPTRGVEGLRGLRRALAEAGTAVRSLEAPQPSHSPRILRGQQLQADLYGQAGVYTRSPAHPAPPLVSAENRSASSRDWRVGLSRFISLLLCNPRSYRGS